MVGAVPVVPAGMEMVWVVEPSAFVVVTVVTGTSPIVVPPPPLPGDCDKGGGGEAADRVAEIAAASLPAMSVSPLLAAAGS